MADATNTAVRRAARFSTAITATQPAAAPIRSAPYITPIAAPVRVSASVTTIPDTTKGSASTVVSSASAAASEAAATRTGGNGKCRFATCDAAIVIANAVVSSGRAR